jgi:hypothetical protein
LVLIIQQKINVQLIFKLFSQHVMLPCLHQSAGGFDSFPLHFQKQLQKQCIHNGKKKIRICTHIWTCHSKCHWDFCGLTHFTKKKHFYLNIILSSNQLYLFSKTWELFQSCLANIIKYNNLVYKYCSINGNIFRK